METGNRDRERPTVQETGVTRGGQTVLSLGLLFVAYFVCHIGHWQGSGVSFGGGWILYLQNFFPIYDIARHHIVFVIISSAASLVTILLVSYALSRRIEGRVLGATLAILFLHIPLSLLSRSIHFYPGGVIYDLYLAIRICGVFYIGYIICVDNLIRRDVLSKPYVFYPIFGLLSYVGLLASQNHITNVLGSFDLFALAWALVFARILILIRPVKPESDVDVGHVQDGTPGRPRRAVPAGKVQWKGSGNLVNESGGAGTVAGEVVDRTAPAEIPKKKAAVGRIPGTVEPKIAARRDAFDGSKVPIKKMIWIGGGAIVVVLALFGGYSLFKGLLGRPRPSHQEVVSPEPSTRPSRDETVSSEPPPPPLRDKTVSSEPSPKPSRDKTVSHEPPPTPSPAAPWAELSMFEDEFNSGNADNWEVKSGSWSVSGNAYHQTANAKPARAETRNELSYSNGFVLYASCRIVKPLSFKGRDFGWFSGSDNAIWVQYTGHVKEISIRCKVRGQRVVDKVIPTIPSSEWTGTDNRPHHFELSVIGEHFALLRDGVLLHNQVDRRFAQLPKKGRIFLYTWGSHTSFDDVAFRSVPTADVRLERLRPHLSAARINEGQLSGMSARDLSLARNSIFAKHGRRFKTDWIRGYFEDQVWYRPNPGYRDDMLTKTELANVETILKYEKKMGFK